MVLNKIQRYTLCSILPVISLLIGCGETTQPILSAGPSSFNIAAEQGNSNTPTWTLSIWNSDGGTLHWSVSDNADWLTFAPTTGNSTGEVGNVTLSTDISGMEIGNYSTIIIVSAPGTSIVPQEIPVTLTINPPLQGEAIDVLDTTALLQIGYTYPEKVVTVEGIIVNTYYVSGQPTFLDFHEPHETYFKALIREDNRDKFIQAFPPNPETYFKNKKVRIEGTITVYKGAPEIILNDPSQIWIVQ